MPVERPNSCASESHFLHRPGVFVDGYHVVNLEGAVGEDSNGAEEVGDGFFRGQGYGDAAEPCAEKDGFNVLVEDVVDDEDNGDNGDGYAKGLSYRRDKHIVEHSSRLACPADKIVLDDVDKAVNSIGYGYGCDGLGYAEPGAFYGGIYTFDIFGVRAVEDQTQARQV